MDNFKFDGDESCTEDQWLAMFSSKPWCEFLDTIKARLSITRTELETCTPEQFQLLQGEAKQCRFTMDFESLIKSEIESKRKEQNNG